ncbi:MAG: response regulator transcription factor [Actinobacteria bacterium]|nr:response regulator transcription factor [Actinomycetota bacterium]
MGREIRVLVVDDDAGLVAELARTLPVGVSVLGPFDGVDEAAARCADGSADLTVVDLDRADQRGFELVGALRDACERARVLVMTDRDGAELVAGALAAGACGFLSKVTGADDIVRTFRRAIAGELVLPASELAGVVGRLVRRGPEVSNQVRLASLTTRENEILLALCDGKSTSEVAGSFGISRMTVQSHVKNILSKLAVHSKIEAVTLAWRHGAATQARTA